MGQSFIHQSTQTAAVKQLAWEYVTQDVIPSLTPSPLDLAAYRDVVLSRFANPYIQDTNQRVAADGLSKIPGFITPTLMACYERGATPSATAVLPALFFLFLQRWHRGELPYAYQDGVLDETAMHTLLAADDALERFARNETLFGALANDARFGALLEQTVGDMAAWVKTHQPAATTA